MKHAAIGWVLLLIALPAFSAPLTIEGVAAYVNDGTITVGEVKEMIAPALGELQKTYPGEELKTKAAELYQEALEELIATRLILKAYGSDTKINKAAVEKHVEARVNEFIQERFGGDRQEFLKALQEERMPLEEWKRRLRERVIVGLMRNRDVDSHVVVSPREVRAAYESNREEYKRPERARLRVIRIHGGTNATDRTVREGLAHSVAQKLAAGSDFGDLARQFSEDPSSAKGGEWGWLALPDLRTELSQAVARLESGKSSGVVTMDGDFYLVRVEEREAAGVVPFDEVRSSIEKDLRRKESRRLYKLWIQSLRKDAYIEVVDSVVP